MSFLVIWGWVCAAVGSVVSVPQLVRLLRGRTSAGLSPLMWELNTAAAIGWAVHGVNTGMLNIIIPNAIMAVFGAMVVRMIQTDRELSAAGVLAPIVAVTATLMAVELFTTPELFGIAVLIPLSFGMLGQTIDLIREPDLAGISAPTLTLTSVIQYMWVAWAIGVGDSSVIICGTVLGVISTFNVVWLVLRLRGLPARTAAVS